MLLLVGQALAATFLGRAARPKRPLLATTIRSVTSRSTGLAAERNEPQAHEPTPLALLPHDLTAGEHPQVVLQDGHDVHGQAAVGLAAEVGHVDGDAPTGLKHPLALVEHVAQQPRYSMYEPGTPAVELLLVLLSAK